MGGAQSRAEKMVGRDKPEEKERVNGNWLQKELSFRQLLPGRRRDREGPDSNQNLRKNEKVCKNW